MGVVLALMLGMTQLVSFTIVVSSLEHCLRGSSSVERSLHRQHVRVMGTETIALRLLKQTGYDIETGKSRKSKERVRTAETSMLNPA